MIIYFISQGTTNNIITIIKIIEKLFSNDVIFGMTNTLKIFIIKIKVMDHPYHLLKKTQ